MAGLLQFVPGKPAQTIADPSHLELALPELLGALERWQGLPVSVENPCYGRAAVALAATGHDTGDASHG